MIRAVALVLALSGALGGAVDPVPDPLGCPEPDQPNCGAPNGAGGWEFAPAAEAAEAPPDFTG
jgi:hypothetical protein